MAKRKLDLNRASAGELETIEGVDSVRARRIVEARPIGSWADVEAIEGIGKELLQTIRARAALRDGQRRTKSMPARAAARTARAPARRRETAPPRRQIEAAEEDIEEEIEMEALFAIAAMDVEAARAYRIGAEAVDDEKLADMLRRFASDHERHVQAYEKLATKRNVEWVVPPIESTPGLLGPMAEVMGAFGVDVVIATMIANERLTNTTYETVLMLVEDPEARELVARHRRDEERHLSTLLAEAQKQ